MSETKQKIQVWCVLDNKAGHRSQTLGLLDCLRLRFEVSVVELRYKPWTRPLGRMMQKIWPHGCGLANVGLETALADDAVTADVVIGSGGGVQWALAALARKYNAYSIYLGSPRNIPVADYGQVLHYVPSLGEQGVTIIPMMPGPVSVSSVSAAWEKFRQGHLKDELSLACCLVGGDGSGYQWGKSDGEQLARLMNEVHRSQGLRWLVTTSRRTPAVMETALRNGLNPAAVADSCWAGLGDQRRVVAAYLGAAQQVIVSEDSMSMVQEALASSHQVSVFGSQQHTINQRHEQFLQSAQKHGWLQRLDLTVDSAAQLCIENKAHYAADLSAQVADAVAGPILTFLQRKNTLSAR